MKAWLRNKAINLLFRLLIYPAYDVPDHKFQKTLAELWLNQAFRDYLAKRKHVLREYLSGGQGLISRDTYLIAMGQRIEVDNFARHTETCYNQISKALKEARNANTAATKQ